MLFTNTKSKSSPIQKSAISAPQPHPTISLPAGSAKCSLEALGEAPNSFPSRHSPLRRSQPLDSHPCPVSPIEEIPSLGCAVTSPEAAYIRNVYPVSSNTQDLTPPSPVSPLSPPLSVSPVFFPEPLHFGKQTPGLTERSNTGHFSPNDHEQRGFPLDGPNSGITSTDFTTSGLGFPDDSRQTESQAYQSFNSTPNRITSPSIYDRSVPCSPEIKRQQKNLHYTKHYSTPALPISTYTPQLSEPKPLEPLKVPSGMHHRGKESELEDRYTLLSDSKFRGMDEQYTSPKTEPRALSREEIDYLANWRKLLRIQYGAVFFVGILALSALILGVVDLLRIDSLVLRIPMTTTPTNSTTVFLVQWPDSTPSIGNSTTPQSSSSHGKPASTRPPATRVIPSMTPTPEAGDADIEARQETQTLVVNGLTLTGFTWPLTSPETTTVTTKTTTTVTGTTAVTQHAKQSKLQPRTVRVVAPMSSSSAVRRVVPPWRWRRRHTNHATTGNTTKLDIYWNRYKLLYNVGEKVCRDCRNYMKRIQTEDNVLNEQDNDISWGFILGLCNETYVDSENEPLMAHTFTSPDDRRDEEANLEHLWLTYRTIGVKACDESRRPQFFNSTRNYFCSLGDGLEPEVADLLKDITLPLDPGHRPRVGSEKQQEQRDRNTVPARRFPQMRRIVTFTSHAKRETAIDKDADCKRLYFELSDWAGQLCIKARLYPRPASDQISVEDDVLRDVITEQLASSMSIKLPAPYSMNEGCQSKELEVGLGIARTFCEGKVAHSILHDGAESHYFSKYLSLLCGTKDRLSREVARYSAEHARPSRAHVVSSLSFPTLSLDSSYFVKPMLANRTAVPTGYVKREQGPDEDAKCKKLYLDLTEIAKRLREHLDNYNKAGTGVRKIEDAGMRDIIKRLIGLPASGSTEEICQSENLTKGLKNAQEICNDEKTKETISGKGSKYFQEGVSEFCRKTKEFDAVFKPNSSSASIISAMSFTLYPSIAPKSITNPPSVKSATATPDIAARQPSRMTTIFARQFEAYLSTYTGPTESATPPPAPPGDVTVPMITYATPRAFELVTADVPTGNISSKLPSDYSFNGMSRTWLIQQPYPLPTGYYGTTLVPAASQTGELTYYDGKNQSPKCEIGGPLAANEVAVAISWQIFSFNLCNRRMLLSWQDGVGKGLHGEDNKKGQMELRVRDRCTACRPEDIDVLAHVFDEKIAPIGAGRLLGTWRWMKDDEPAQTGTG